MKLTITITDYPADGRVGGDGKIGGNPAFSERGECGDRVSISPETRSGSGRYQGMIASVASVAWSGGT
jgi:hypothetical protein